MNELARVQALYGAYVEKATQLEINRKPGQGLFGIGTKPADDPCHERFILDLRKLTGAFAEEGASPEAVREVLAYIFRAPLEHRDPASIYWTLIAAHSAAQDLAGRLSPADAEALRAQYARDYRRWNRLPIQDKVLAALKDAASNG